jgi:hypothetical protein
MTSYGFQVPKTDRTTVLWGFPSSGHLNLKKIRNILTLVKTTCH